MKICFLTGPQNSKRCGITDYVNLLRVVLENYGHDVSNICLSGSKTFKKVITNLPEADIFSFQFAPYAFSPNGMLGVDLINLGKVLRKNKTHLNFHEVWIGAYKGASLYEKFMGWRQKREILEFVKVLNPSVITSTNSAALDRLQKEGINATYLYLFGNIPFIETDVSTNSDIFKVAFFGTLYDKFPYDLLGKRLCEIYAIYGSKIEFRIIGLQRESLGFKKLRKVASCYNFSIAETGELSSTKVAKEINDCKIGVSTTPYDAIGKSGASAAMLEHGLPILAFDDEDTPKDQLFVINEFIGQIFLINDPFESNKLLHFISQERKPFFDGVAYTAKNMVRMVS
ncbi:MAG: hypothetical protein CMC93_01055 [Flavobacteriaceae bacterium]|nr:hypothetical protein [Flavobacteriaceae bacterium]